ncbi:MAG: hypothetical protein LBE20_06125 [Deltaproteobacteria bacterium]|jgi:hypothetical protein|nr:hypothetical protein [Deltaproteobacteria bacterium]
MFRKISIVFCCIFVVQILTSCTPTGKVGQDVYQIADKNDIINYETLLAMKEKSNSKVVAKQSNRILVAKNTLVVDIGYSRGEKSTFGFIKNIYKFW